MSDADIEARLRPYRPVGPPDDLRDRVLSGGSPAGSRGRWLSIAALLLIIIVLQVLAAAERASVRARLDDSAKQEKLIREIAQQLGGGELALQTARMLIEVSAVTGGGE